MRAKELKPGWFAPRRTKLARLKAHRFHLIEAGHHTAKLEPDTKVAPDREVLRQLYLGGLIEGERWLSANKQFIGKRATVNLRDHFIAPKAVPAIEPANQVDTVEELAQLAKSA